jgi:hypothetical protein
MSNAARITGGILSTADPVTVIYGYDNVGNKAFQSDNGDTLIYTYMTYEDLNRLVAQTDDVRDVGTIDAYTLNDDGTRKQLVEKTLGYYFYPVTSTTVWAYDALQRLTGETLSFTSPNSTMSGTMNGTYGYTDSFTYGLNRGARFSNMN